MASRALEDCVVDLSIVFSQVESIFRQTFPRYELRITCTHRSREEQLALYKEGKTRIDGVSRLSRHNLKPAEAFDFGIFKRQPQGMPATYVDDLLKAKKIDPDLVTSLYWNAAQLFQRFGFRSGNDWNDNALPVLPDPNESLNDPYHVEVRK